MTNITQHYYNGKKKEKKMAFRVTKQHNQIGRILASAIKQQQLKQVIKFHKKFCVSLVVYKFRNTEKLSSSEFSARD